MKQENKEIKKGGENKDEKNVKKKITLDSSSIIMIVCLFLIFALTVLNKIGIIPQIILWPFLVLFLLIMLFVMFKNKKL